MHLDYLFWGGSALGLLGWAEASRYTAFAIMLSYAFHGWVVTHAPQDLKIQPKKPYVVSPQAMAVRSSAALLTELVYTLYPFAPPSTTWLQFFVWTAALNIYWDLHFYVFHRWAHNSKFGYTVCFLFRLCYLHDAATDTLPILFLPPDV